MRFSFLRSLHRLSGNSVAAWLALCLSLLGIVLSYRSVSLETEYKEISITPRLAFVYNLPIRDVRIQNTVIGPADIVGYMIGFDLDHKTGPALLSNFVTADGFTKYRSEEVHDFLGRAIDKRIEIAKIDAPRNAMLSPKYFFTSLSSAIKPGDDIRVFQLDIDKKYEPLKDEIMSKFIVSYCYCSISRRSCNVVSVGLDEKSTDRRDFDRQCQKMKKS